mmetsp:Transcript_129195/g.359775  ORF Transcript_129195/g.359775 Transcript_129195/m.359775 type:complete len:201 (-) Transcript_129195:251-853(-)
MPRTALCHFIPANSSVNASTCAVLNTPNSSQHNASASELPMSTPPQRLTPMAKGPTGPGARIAQGARAAGPEVPATLPLSPAAARPRPSFPGHCPSPRHPRRRGRPGRCPEARAPRRSARTATAATARPRPPATPQPPRGPAPLRWCCRCREYPSADPGCPPACGPRRARWTKASGPRPHPTVAARSPRGWKCRSAARGR